MSHSSVNIWVLISGTIVHNVPMNKTESLLVQQSRYGPLINNCQKLPLIIVTKEIVMIQQTARCVLMAAPYVIFELVSFEAIICIATTVATITFYLTTYDVKRSFRYRETFYVKMPS